MPTIVDALVTTITLDPAGYKRGQEMVARSNKELREDATKTAKELSSQGKQMAEFFTAAKTEVLGLIGALVGSAGIVAFTKDTTRALADMGREARNIGISAQSLNAFQNVIERNGGSAQSATASMKGLVDQIERFKVFGDPTVFKFLNPIGANINDSPLMIWQKFVKFAAEHKNDMPLVNLVGHGLGFDQGLINATIQIGDVTKATQELHNEMQRVATPAMVKHAIELQQAWLDLQHQATFTGETVMDQFSPALTAAAQGMTIVLQNKEAVTVITALTTAMVGLGALRITGGLLWLLGFGRAASALAALPGALARLAPALALLGFTGPAGGEDPEFSRQKNDEFLRDHPPGSRDPISQWWHDHMPSWITGGSRPPVADQTLDPVQQRFLQALSAPESGGAYDVKNGGARFSDFSRFPEGVGPGGTSSAAGRYQFVSATWHQQQQELGLPDFSPASQDRAAWYLSAKTYRLKTGRDLESDLKAGGHEGPIAAAVGQHWGSLKADTLRGTRFSNTEGPAAGPGGGAPPPVMHVDPSMVPRPGGNAPISTVNTDRSVSSQIGTINIHTQATDAAGIASDMHGAMNDVITQSDRGIE